MQDDELKKRLRAMRLPAVDSEAESNALQRSLETFLNPEMRSSAAKAAPWSWRDWLWPSPYAWSAIAGIWVLLLVWGGTARPHKDEPGVPESAKAEWAPSIDSSSFTARADYRQILKQIEQSKAVP